MAKVVEMDEQVKLSEQLDEDVGPSNGQPKAGKIYCIIDLTGT